MSESKLLYHYCPASSFEAIIRSQEFHLSNSNYTNDSTEAQWHATVWGSIIEEWEKKNKCIAPHYLKNLFEACEFYFLSFSEKADSLDQWARYADNGNGFAIAFNSASFKFKDESLNLCKVTYNSDEQRKNLKKMFDIALEFKNEDLDIIDTTSKLKKVFKNPYEFKNPGFSEEAEWRITGIYDKKIKYKVNNLGYLVPYRATEINNSLLEVYIGPKNKTKKHHVEDFLKRTGHPQAKVINSKVTYR